MFGKLLVATNRSLQFGGTLYAVPFVMTLIRGGIIFSVIAATTTVVLGIGMVSNSSNAVMVNPFERYASIMPGQPTLVLANFDCEYLYTPESLKQYRCMIAPASNYIKSVYIASLDKTISEVGMGLKSVRVGDLFMLWGRPSSILKEARRYIVQWANGTTAYVPHNNHDVLNLYWDVASVMFQTVSK